MTMLDVNHNHATKGGISFLKKNLGNNFEIDK